MKKKPSRKNKPERKINNQLQALNTILLTIEEKHKTDLSTIFNLISRFRKREEILVHLKIFAERKLGPLEALTVFLKDKLALNYHQIAVLTKRNDRTIWTTYQKAIKKVKKTAKKININKNNVPEISALDILSSNIEEKYKNNLSTIFILLSRLRKREEILVPLKIFAERKLGPLEALTVFLKDKLALNYHQIAVLTKRNDRTIWTTYQKAKGKLK